MLCRKVIYVSGNNTSGEQWYLIISEKAPFPIPKPKLALGVPVLLSTADSNSQESALDKRERPVDCTENTKVRCSETERSDRPHEDTAPIKN